LFKYDQYDGGALHSTHFIHSLMAVKGCGGSATTNL